MTVYNSDKMAAGVQPKALYTASGVRVLAQIALAAALVANDTINMVNLPSDPSLDQGAAPNYGPVITGMALDSDKLDSNGAPAILLDVGDGTTAARFYSQSNVAQAGGYASPNVAGTLGYAPFASSFSTYPTTSKQTYTVVVKCHTAAATWQNGTIRLAVEYSFDA